jgi:hypothetical protein
MPIRPYPQVSGTEPALNPPVWKENQEDGQTVGKPLDNRRAEQLYLLSMRSEDQHDLPRKSDGKADGARRIEA